MLRSGWGLGLSIGLLISSVRTSAVVLGNRYRRRSKHCPDGIKISGQCLKKLAVKKLVVKKLVFEKIGLAFATRSEPEEVPAPTSSLPLHLMA